MIFALSGCGTTRYQSGDAASASMMRAEASLDEEIEALNQAMASLDALVNQPADVQKSYARFSKSVDRLSDAATQANLAMVEMKANSEAHLNEWDGRINAMTFEVIREQSSIRRSAVSNQVAELLRRHDETSAVVQPLIQYFEDLKLALASDLTADGLANVREFVSKTHQNVQKTRFALRHLADDIANMGQNISSTASLKTATNPPAMGGTAADSGVVAGGDGR